MFSDNKVLDRNPLQYKESRSSKSPAIGTIRQNEAVYGWKPE